MTRNRRNRLITVLFALVSLLSMQFAMASYICPGTGSKPIEIAAMTEAGMPCAESMAFSMDAEQSGLCHAHCQTEQQSSDHYQVPLTAALADLSAGFSLPRIVFVPSGVSLQAPLSTCDWRCPMPCGHNAWCEKRSTRVTSTF